MDHGRPAAGAVPVLMYHRVARAGAASHRRWRVTPEDLDEQLALLRGRDRACVGLTDWSAALRAGEALPGPSVVLTFDDAFADVAVHALPLLERHGMTATVFVPTGHVGGRSDWTATAGADEPLMDWDALADLVARGLAVGAHSVSHRPLTGLAPREVRDEAVRSRAALEDRLGVAVTAFAYPYGAHDAAVMAEVARAGFEIAVTTEPRGSAPGDAPLAVPRIEVGGEAATAALVAALAP